LAKLQIDIAMCDLPNSVSLPIVGSKEPCLLDADYKKWFENKTLQLASDGHVVFYESQRGKQKQFYVNKCVMSIAMSLGEKQMHPNGVGGLRLYVKVNTPKDIRDFCLSEIKKRF
jgi:hypothetical protein